MERGLGGTGRTEEKGGGLSEGWDGVRGRKRRGREAEGTWNIMFWNVMGLEKEGMVI